MKDIKLFDSNELNQKVIELASAVVRAPIFADHAHFNPIRDDKELFLSAKKVEVSHEGYSLETASYASKYNILSGRTQISSGVVAGLFAEILKQYGYEAFKQQWHKYKTDYVTEVTAGNPYEVADMLCGTILKVDDVKLPSAEKVFAFKLMHIWRVALDTKSPWIAPPKDHTIHRDREIYTVFKKVAGLSTAKLRRLLNVETTWDHSKVDLAILYCVATGEHPLQFLNYAGLFSTHKDGQPEEFKLANPNTQNNEIDIISKETGQYIRTEQAKQLFTGGFFTGLVARINQITWHDESNNVYRLFHKEFARAMDCLHLEEFSMLFGAEWKIVTGYDDSLEAANYYYSLGMVEPNNIIVKEVSQTQDSKRRAKSLNKDKLKSKLDRLATGNPLFDIDLLEE